MQPTRRRYLAITGVGIGSGVAGCLSSGSNISYPDPEPEEDEDEELEDEEQHEPEGEDEPEEEEEDDEPDVEAINERLAEETDDIYDELRWFETEYDDMIRQHRSRVREVVAALDSLLETLDEEGRIEAEQLADVESFAREVADEVNDIPEPQFTEHFNYRGFNSRFSTIDRDRRREDWELVESELEELKSRYRGASTSSAVARRYSSNPIDNRLHDWFGGGGKLYETRYISDEDGHHPETGDVPGYGVYVINDSSRDIRFTPIGRAPTRVLSTMDETFEPFEEPADRQFRLYVRIHDVGGSGDVDPRDTDSFNVYGQRYEDLVAADAAFDAVTEDKEIEDQEEWGDETWSQVLYSRDGGRRYAYLIRAGTYLFSVGPSRTPWDDRDDDWNELLDGTWMRS